MNATAEPEYQLKHRLVGAAVIVVLAVVIIPLFLSEPALEANSGVDEEGVAIQTFRSRITPLNLNNINGAEQAEEDDLRSAEVDSRKPVLLDLTLDSEENTQPPSVDEPKEEKTALVMTNNAESTEEKEAKPALQPISEPEPKTEPVVEKKPETKVAAVKKVEEPKTVAKEAVSQEETADSGWVVRVGTFSKKANVDSVSTLLNNSGFSPKTKLVDTSLGQSTRVWLGPYAKRETANKISERLKSLIGEKGYVTRTNS